MERRRNDCDALYSGPKKGYSSSAPRTCVALNNLAQLLTATNRLQEAEPLMRRALAIEERSRGPEHPAVARDLNHLANPLGISNRLPEAEALSRRHLAILLHFTRRTGHPHPHLDAALASYKAILKQRGRSEAEIEADIRALQDNRGNPGRTEIPPCGGRRLSAGCAEERTPAPP